MGNNMINKKVQHGGNLLEIIHLYGGDRADWVDLSTGVSPFPYPVPMIPIAAWHHLPQTNDGLETTAAQYYQSALEPLVVAGSQAAIMALPGLLLNTLTPNRNKNTSGRVAIPRVGYKEHQHAWQKEWDIELYNDFPSAQTIERCDVVLVINPNNPSGFHFSRKALLDLHLQVSTKGGWLIVDEAFIDCSVESSLLSHEVTFDNLIVLRSVGKFFGLAGARVGFVFAPVELLNELNHELGPWTVAGPSRWVVKQALLDTKWQKQTQIKLNKSIKRLQQLLSQYFTATPLMVKFSGTTLFITTYLDQAATVHQRLCSKKVYTRLCDEGDSIRFGLPASDSEWTKLEGALKALSGPQGIGVY
jgi:cobalamin biosynthetic protein CobC